MVCNVIRKDGLRTRTLVVYRISGLMTIVVIRLVRLVSRSLSVVEVCVVVLIGLLFGWGVGEGVSRGWVTSGLQTLWHSVILAMLSVLSALLRQSFLR